MKTSHLILISVGVIASASLLLISWPFNLSDQSTLPQPSTSLPPLISSSGVVVRSETEQSLSVPSVTLVVTGTIKQQVNNDHGHPHPNLGRPDSSPPELLPYPPLNKFFTFNPLNTWYGLTNQMMCYAAAIRYGMESNRRIIWPPSAGGETASVFAKGKKSDILEKMAQDELRNKLRDSTGTRDQGVAGLVFSDLFDVDQTQEALHIAISRELENHLSKNDADNPPSTYRLRGKRPQNSVRNPLVVPVINSTLSDVPHDAFPMVSMNKKKLFLPQREVARNLKIAESGRGEGILSSLVKKSDQYNFVRHHNFFMRFPWTTEMSQTTAERIFSGSDQNVTNFRVQSLAMDEGTIFANFVFQHRIRLRVAALESLLPEHYLALHFRLEPDSVLIRAKNAKSPSTHQVVEFIREFVSPIICRGKSGTSRREAAIYLLTGAVTKELNDVIRLWNDDAEKRSEVCHPKLLTSQHLVQKAKEEGIHVPVLPRAFGKQREVHTAEKGVKTTQDHFGSAVDLELASRAAEVLLPDYSTFRFAVFGRRCYPRSPIGINNKTPDAKRVFLYSISSLSGKIEKPRDFPCSERASGWAGHRSWTE